jgi:hypothetical protein
MHRLAVFTLTNRVTALQYSIIAFFRVWQLYNWLGRIIMPRRISWIWILRQIWGSCFTGASDAVNPLHPQVFSYVGKRRADSVMKLVTNPPHRGADASDIFAIEAANLLFILQSSCREILLAGAAVARFTRGWGLASCSYCVLRAPWNEIRTCGPRDPA